MSGNTINPEVLRTFSPLDSLKRENLAALAKKTQLRTAEAGESLFRKGDNENRTVYLLSGTLELDNLEGKKRKIQGGTDSAKLPVSPQLPRQYNARALDAVQFISIDSDLLDVMLTWDQTGAYEVSEFQPAQEGDGDATDWMTTLLSSKAFHRIPAGNIQAIFMRMQQVEYKTGDVVIQQGDKGDFFFTITRGKCMVTRETPLNVEGIRLAELAVGDTFGEESLISNAPRNATITMLTDGAVMRLGKDDFNALMNEPMVEWVSYEEANQVVADGGQWLDVRLPSEFEKSHEQDAINIPLYFMRLKLSALDPKVKYVLCCDTGARSSAGAFILAEKDFDACVLQKGLNAVKRD